LGCYYHKSVCLCFSVDLQLPIGLNQVEVCAWADTTISLYVSPCRLVASNRVKSGRGLCLGCYYHKSVCLCFSVDLQLPIGLNQVEVCAWAATTISLSVCVFQ
jgi:hypothetical protein